jgi:hypothetical protein
MTKQKVSGEGNYAATRRYRKRLEKFLENSNVEQAAARAAPVSSREAGELQAAEAAGKRRAKAEDPAIRRRSAGVGSSTRAKSSRHSGG